jgi:hypothetical protein
VPAIDLRTVLVEITRIRRFQIDDLMSWLACRSFVSDLEDCLLLVRCDRSSSEVSRPWRHPSESPNTIYHPAYLARPHHPATRWLEQVAGYCHKLNPPPSDPTSSILSTLSSIVLMAFCAGCCFSRARQVLASLAHLA